MQTLLPNRSVIRLSGADTDQLLQGIITQDIALLKNQPILFSAMLSAQGKFQHDFFIHADGADRMIEIDASHKDAFVKKLKMYKLRSQVTIEEVDSLHVHAAWDEAPSDEDWHPDPRLKALGWRRLSQENTEGNSIAYNAHRLALGVPEGAIDATDRHFILELGYDQLHGVSFTKGCFVGQEPTARMHYRKVLRKGLFQVRAEQALPDSETPITSGEQILGEMRSSQGQIGLAFCRMEKLQSADQPVLAGDITIELSVPEYMRAKWDEIQSANGMENADSRDG